MGFFSRFFSKPKPGGKTMDRHDGDSSKSKIRKEKDKDANKKSDYQREKQHGDDPNSPDKGVQKKDNSKEVNP